MALKAAYVKYIDVTCLIYTEYLITFFIVIF